MLDARRGMDGEVAMVKFVDNEVGRRCQRRTLVGFPSLWICLFEVYNGPSPTVYAHSLGKDARRFAQVKGRNVEGIETSFEVAFGRNAPQVFACGFHSQGLQWLSPLSFGINPYQYALSIGRCVKLKHRFVGRVSHFVHVLRTYVKPLGANKQGSHDKSFYVHIVVVIELIS